MRRWCVVWATWLACSVPGWGGPAFEPVSNQSELIREVFSDRFEGRIDGRVLNAEDRRADPGRSGRGLRCEATTTTKQHGFSWTIRSLPGDAHFLVGAWSYPQQLEPFVGRGRYRMSVTLTLPGDVRRARERTFDRDDRTWQYRYILLDPVPAGSVMTVTVECSQLQGTVWFDDVTVHAIDRSKVVALDNWLYRMDSPPARREPAVTVGSALQIAIDSQGGICGLSVDGKPAGGGPLGGVWFEPTGLTAIKRLNPATPLPLDDSLKRLKGRLDRDKVVRVAGDITETLKLAYTVQPHRRGVELSISAVNLSQTDLVGTVLVALPVDAVAGRWYRDGYASHTIEATASEYRNAVWLGVGKSGYVSRYPLSAVTLASGDALAWAVPMYPVRFVRLSYNTPLRAMILGWDVALRASQEGTLRTYLYPLAGEEPFREALAEYYRWQADAFEVRVTRQGLWMPFAEVSQVDRFEDFGFAFKEGLNDLAFDDKQGLYTFKYIEPNALWIKSADRPVFRTQARAIADRHVQDAPAAKKAEALAVLNAGLFDPSGGLRFEVRHAPWASGPVFPLNPDPDVPGRPNRAQALLGDDLGLADERIDGLYIDNLDGWTLTRNYRRKHIDAFDDVPIYDPFTGKVCLSNLQSVARFVETTSAALRTRGKFLMCNYHPTLIAFAAPFLDVMGQETYWKWRGTWQPMSLSDMFFRRALCYHKPYCLLQNTDFARFTAEDVARYLDRAAAFGFWPGMFSPDAYHHHYFKNPTWYNRDRAAFRRVTRQLTQLTQAGWEPTRLATIRPDTLVFERFGRGKNMRWTVYNPTDAPIDFVLTPTKAPAVITARVGVGRTVIVRP